MPATSTSLETPQGCGANRDTNFWHQRPNNIIEAYTGNDIGHKEVRTSWSLDIASLLRLRHNAAQVQMATVLTVWKPTRRERFGEFSEGLPGFTKSVACVERNAQEPFGFAQGRLGRPEWFLHVEVGISETTSRKANGLRGSDQSIVLWDGNAVHLGKGLTGIRNSHRKHKPYMLGRWIVPTSLRETRNW